METEHHRTVVENKNQKMNNTNNKSEHASQEIDFAKLNALSAEIIENQATMNIGTLGHVSHGKSTIVEGISGIRPIKFQQEEARNITIKLGYANFKVYKCDRCPRPICYKSFGSKQKGASISCTAEGCDGTMHLIRHFSFVDCPGHECLMSTMLNGAAVMDAGLLVIASNQKVPQPQTAEHLVAAELMNLKHMVTLQTKLDLVDKSEASKNREQIVDFLQGTVAEKSPVIPICCSAIHKINLEYVLQYLCEDVPVPQRDLESPPHFSVVRSFDVNNPGDDFATMKGGVAGGSLTRGIIKLGDELEIRPGLITKDANGKIHCAPIFTRVVSLYSEKNSLKFAAPSGLIAIGTLLDPNLTKGDRLVGQVIGHVGKLPDVYVEIEVKCNMLLRLIGVSEDSSNNIHQIKKLSKSEIILLNIGSSTTQGKVVAVKNHMAKISLAKPACIELHERVSLSRNISGAWRLIGYGSVTHGIPMKLEAQVAQISSSAIEQTMTTEDQS